MLGRNTDGKLVRRPLSPHLQVYKPQITSALSIFHRITGVALAVGTLLMTAWLVAAATSPDAFYNVQAFIFSWLGTLLLIGWTAAIVFPPVQRHPPSGLGCRRRLRQATLQPDRHRRTGGNRCVHGADLACRLVGR